MNIDELKIGDLVYCEHCCEDPECVPCVTKYVGITGGRHQIFEIIACKKMGLIGCQCYNIHELDETYLI